MRALTQISLIILALISLQAQATCEETLAPREQKEPVPFQAIEGNLFNLLTITFQRPLLDDHTSPTPQAIRLISELIQFGVSIEPDDLDAALDAISYARNFSLNASGLAEALEEKFIIRSSTGLTPWKEVFGKYSAAQILDLRLRMKPRDFRPQ